MRTALLLLSATIALGALFENYADNAPAFNVELARYVNNLKTTWTASEEPAAMFANRTHGEAKRLMGTLWSKPSLPRRTWGSVVSAAPDAFDARVKWPHCPTIGEIRDQGSCGSCWAVGAAEAISDRLCTTLGDANSSMRNISISATELISCCVACGFGCEGGYAQNGWQYWTDTGLTTNDCYPYPFPKCEHHMPKKNFPECSTTPAPTPPCPSSCKDGSPFSKATRYYGDSPYLVDEIPDFMSELSKNGPFEVTFLVYQDFEAYKSGVYQHKAGPLLGGHAVKIVGWGSDNGVPYWTIANSWNTDWGENGFFRIIRGQDECGIERFGIAGMPKKP